MITAIIILMLCLCVIARRKSVKQQTAAKATARLNTLLYNIEVYDGSARGQKRMEDIK